MGEWRQTMHCKVSERERQQLVDIHNGLAGMHENLSQTLRWAIRVVHILMFTEGSLQLLLMAAQGSQCGHGYHSDKQLGFQFASEKPPLVRLMHAVGDRRAV